MTTQKQIEKLMTSPDEERVVLECVAEIIREMKGSVKGAGGSEPSSKTVLLALASVVTELSRLDEEDIALVIEEI